MGKGTELWDDSALINAFDHAMATYKEMHTKNNNGDFTKEEKHTSDSNENDVVLIDKATGHFEIESNGYNISNDTAETCVRSSNTEAATGDLSLQENNPDIQAPESDPFPCTNGKTYAYSDQQTMDYDELVRKYYELEEQKQKIVQQLNQTNYWNYQTPVQSSTCQAHEVSAYNASEHGLHTPCSLCSCHCVAVPLISTSACPINGMSAGGYGCYPSFLSCCSGSQAHLISGIHCPADNGTCSVATSCIAEPVKHSKADENVVKAGMLAAERAINSIKMELSVISNACEEKGKGNEESSGMWEQSGSQSISSETDLTAVMNAWYMAGFYTGRYLSEQSKKSAQQ